MVKEQESKKKEKLPEEVKQLAIEEEKHLIKPLEEEEVAVKPETKARSGCLSF